MIQINKIRKCYCECLFFHYDEERDTMECNHPHWNDFDADENLIIAQDNSKDGKFPEKCPLKEEQLTVIYTR